MKTTKNLALGLFIAMSGLIASGTAYSGPTYVEINKEAVSMSDECKLQYMTPGLDMGDGSPVENNYRYRCALAKKESLNSATTYALTTGSVHTADGEKQCKFYITSKTSGAFNQTWHHIVTTNHPSECAITLIEGDNTFSLRVNFVPYEPPPSFDPFDIGGGSPAVSY